MNTHTGQFDLERDFAVDLDKLWFLLTDANAREAWGAPSDDHILHVEKADLREGGSERHRCGPVEAPEFAVETHWYRIEKPAFACFTETLEFGGARVSVSLVSYELEKTDAGSRLSVAVTVTSFEGAEMIEEHKNGWTSALDRLVQQSPAMAA